VDARALSERVVQVEQSAGAELPATCLEYGVRSGREGRPRLGGQSASAAIAKLDGLVHFKLIMFPVGTGDVTEVACPKWSGCSESSGICENLGGATVNRTREQNEGPGLKCVLRTLLTPRWDVTSHFTHALRGLYSHALRGKIAGSDYRRSEILTCHATLEFSRTTLEVPQRTRSSSPRTRLEFSRTRSSSHATRSSSHAHA